MPPLSPVARQIATLCEAAPGRLVFGVGVGGVLAWLAQLAMRHRVFERRESLVLEGLGLGLQHVVSARAFLTHFERDYAAMNEEYRTYFPPERLPARTCVGVTALAVGALVEIDMIARRP